LVNFDDLAARSMRMAADVAAAGVQVQIVREGDFGLVPAQYASSLALVITELVTNAVEHGFEGKERGTITVTAQRERDLVAVTIADDGVGLTHEPSGLGSSIVRTLIENELGGQITWSGNDAGSVVELTAHVSETR